MKKKNSFLMVLYFIISSSLSFNVSALPKIKITRDTTAEGIPRIKVKNETVLTLACYVAIDGYKKKFLLMPFTVSRWYFATSKHYDHTSFSTWCDSLEFYPEYEKYRQ